MRALVPALLGLLLAISGAASAGQYFQVPETVVVNLSGQPYQPTYVKFTDKGKQAVQDILKTLKITVDGREVALSVQARKVKEVQVDNIRNEEYVAAALGYEVPGKYFVGYLEFKKTKYVVKYEEGQKPVQKTAPGFGAFQATVAEILGQYDESKGLPFVAPAVKPEEHEEEVMLCLPIESEITLKPAVLQMDWYRVLNVAEANKVFLKSATVHAHKDGDKVKVVYAPTKLDAATMLATKVLPSADDIVNAIVNPYLEEVRAVEDAKIRELLEPLKEQLPDKLADIVVDKILVPVIKGLIERCVLSRVESEVKSALKQPVEQALTALVGAYLSQYPATTDVKVLEERKAARQSILFDPMVEAELAVIESAANAVRDQVESVVEDVTEDYAEDIADMLGVSVDTVKETIEKLTVGVLENVMNAFRGFAEWLAKLLALNTLTSMAAAGLLI